MVIKKRLALAVLLCIPAMMYSMQKEKVNANELLFQEVAKGQKANESTIELLLLSDADPSYIIESEQCSALHKVAACGPVELAHTLLTQGRVKTIDSLDKNKLTPLLVAVLNKQGKVARQFIRAGANLFAVDSDGNTALHLFALNNDAKSMKRFIAIALQRNKLEVLSLKNKEGKTAKSYVNPEEYPTIYLWLLIESDLYTIDDNGNTALHLFARNGNTKSIDQFISCALQKNQVEALSLRNKEGKMAQDYLDQTRYPQTYAMLNMYTSLDEK